MSRSFALSRRPSLICAARLARHFELRWPNCILHPSAPGRSNPAITNSMTWPLATSRSFACPWPCCTRSDRLGRLPVNERRQPQRPPQRGWRREGLGAVDRVAPGRRPARCIARTGRSLSSRARRSAAVALCVAGLVWQPYFHPPPFCVGGLVWQPYFHPPPSAWPGWSGSRNPRRLRGRPVTPAYHPPLSSLRTMTSAGSAIG
jgi:hypothetical protein